MAKDRKCLGCWDRGKVKTFAPDHPGHYFCNVWCFYSFLDDAGLRMEYHSIHPDQKAIQRAVRNGLRRMKRAA